MRPYSVPAPLVTLLACPLLALGLGCGDASDPTPEPAPESDPTAEAPDSDRPVEATSLLGEPLQRPDIAGETLATYTANLEAALTDREAAPEDPDAWIWVGRRLAYLGRYREAIETYTEGHERWPEDPRFLRHRGHRKITIRDLAGAEADFAAAWALIRESGAADEVEPDGLPNARGIPVSTLHSNVRYHLALSRYLQGDFEGAAEMWSADVEAAVNADMLVASSYWLWLSLRRLGRDDQAAAVLAAIDPEMDIIENTAYHRLLMLFAGELEESDLLGVGDDALQNTTAAYGVAAWHLVEGRDERAARIFQAIVDGDGPWAAFGYIAAEAERARPISGA
jgi:tetratricopeptide (TPR) repeat protein